MDEDWNEILQAVDAAFQDVTAEIGQYFPPGEMPVGQNPTLGSFDSDWTLYDGHELERQVTKTMDLIIHSY